MRRPERGRVTTLPPLSADERVRTVQAPRVGANRADTLVKQTKDGFAPQPAPGLPELRGSPTLFSTRIERDDIPRVQVVSDGGKAFLDLPAGDQVTIRQIADTQNHEPSGAPGKRHLIDPRRWAPCSRRSVVPRRVYVRSRVRGQPGENLAGKSTAVGKGKTRNAKNRPPEIGAVVVRLRLNQWRQWFAERRPKPMTEIHQADAMTEQLDVLIVHRQIIASTATSRSRGLVFYRVLELAVAHEPVRYRGIVANPSPGKARRPPPGTRGRPPTLERRRARRPWRRATPLTHSREHSPARWLSQMRWWARRYPHNAGVGVGRAPHLLEHSQLKMLSEMREGGAT